MIAAAAIVLGCLVVGLLLAVESLIAQRDQLRRDCTALRAELDRERFLNQKFDRKGR